MLAVTTAVLGGIAGCGTDWPFGSSPRNGEFEPTTIQLSVGRHVDQPLSDDEAEMIFTEASQILQAQDEECPDVSCPVTFELDGSVRSFSAGEAVVTTEAQLDEIFAEPEDIKLVALMLGVCGTSRSSDLSVVLGCAYRGGTAVVTRGADPDVWAHEWGHVQGLVHRDDCPRNVMHSYELDTNALDGDECAAFLSPTPSQGLFRTRMPDETCTRCNEEQVLPRPNELESEWLSRITARIYRAGIPADAVTGRLDSTAVDVLIDLYATSPVPVVRTNAARLIGFSADSRCVSALIAYIDSMPNEIDTAELGVVAESVLALGRLAGTDEAGAAFAFIQAGTDPGAWADHVLVTGDPAEEPVPLDRVLARICIMAVGVSDHPDAESFLLGLDEQTRTGRLAHRWVADQINEALCRRNDQCPAPASVPVQ